MRLHVGGDTQPFIFTGEQLDEELGLVYLRARYYDPLVARFLIRDAFPGVDLLTQSRNRYVYAANNPVLQDDPDGYIVWNLVAGGAAGVLEYTVKVAVSNALEGGPLSNTLEGWDPWEAAIGGIKGAVTYGVPGLGPGVKALISGALDAGASVYQQCRDTGDLRKVNYLQALGEGLQGGLTSLAWSKAPKVPGRLPSGRYWRTALFGAHASREYAKAALSGAFKAGIKRGYEAPFWGEPVRASTNQVYSLTPTSWFRVQQLQTTGAWSIPPSHGK